MICCLSRLFFKNFLFDNNALLSDLGLNFIDIFLFRIEALVILYLRLLVLIIKSNFWIIIVF